MLVFSNVERPNLKHLFLKISHILHGTFQHNIYPEVILDPYLSCLLADLEVIDSTEESSTLITDVLLSTLSLHLDIQGLELDRLTEGRMETRKDRACRVDFIAEFALVLVLLHVIELVAGSQGVLWVLNLRDCVKHLFLLFAHFGLLKK